jgi:hypothetical protein
MKGGFCGKRKGEERRIWNCGRMSIILEYSVL